MNYVEKIVLTQIMVLFSVFSLGGCSGWSDKKVEESKRRGADIIKALEEYKNDTSTYPKTLTDLVPKYVKDILPPVAGNGHWGYKVYPGGIYNLWFEGDSTYEPSAIYSSRATRWSIDTK